VPCRWLLFTCLHREESVKIEWCGSAMTTFEHTNHMPRNMVSGKPIVPAGPWPRHFFPSQLAEGESGRVFFRHSIVLAPGSGGALHSLTGAVIQVRENNGNGCHMRVNAQRGIAYVVCLGIPLQG
jgi:hypothetical protein